MAYKPQIPKPILRQSVYRVSERTDNPKKTNKSEDLEGLKSLRAFYFFEFGLPYLFPSEEKEVAGSEWELNK